MIRETCRDLSTLTTLDLGVDLVGARVEQLDRLILEFPHITVEAKVRLVRVYPLTGDQFGRFNS